MGSEREHAERWHEADSNEATMILAALRERFGVKDVTLLMRQDGVTPWALQARGASPMEWIGVDVPLGGERPTLEGLRELSRRILNAMTRPAQS